MTDSIKLYTTPTITIEQLLGVQGGVQIMVPLDQQTLNNEFVKGIKWKEVVEDIILPTLSVGKLLFGVLSIKATSQQENKILLEINGGYKKLLSLSDEENTKELVTRVSGESAINGNLQYCFTITKGIMRNVTIAFLENEFPDRDWEDVYGECISIEAYNKPDNNSIQVLKDNWEKWGNHDIEFSNYFPLINQLKEKLRIRFGWSSNKLREINTAIRIITEVRNPSSHQNLNEQVLKKTSSTIEAMKTIIKGFERALGTSEVERRCEQLEERRKIIESIKERIKN
jgi:hypothetical protein